MRKPGDGLEECHHPRVTESQCRRALAGLERRTLQAVQRLLGQHALVADAFHLEEFAVDLIAKSRRCERFGTAFAT